MPMPAPVVYVVDDDVSIREALEPLIRHAGWQPEIFASADEFLSRPRALTPSCLILDVALPGLNGLELQQRIAAELRAMPVIFITGYGDIPTSVRAMKAGAAEFLTKPFAEDVLLDAVERAIEQSEAALDRHAQVQSLRERYATLTRREREVMSLVVSGRLNKQVGSDLGISEITVKAHRGKMMQKMKARTIADLVRMATELEPATAQKG